MKYSKIKISLISKHKVVIKIIKSANEVREFLSLVQKQISKNHNNLIIIRRSKSTDKTFNFKVEYGVTKALICEQILELNYTNYSYTDYDNDTNRKGDIWIFGQMFLKDQIENNIEIYIKIKMQEKVICLSYHPKERDIIYPYL